MKKYIFGLIIITLLILSACSQEDVKLNETEEDMDNDNSIVKLIENEDEIIPEIKEKIIEEEDYDLEDLLVEKRISNYNYEESKKITRKLEGVTFDSYEATYSYRDGESEATVGILISDKVNSFDFIDKLDDSDNIEFLEQEEYTFLETDIYFNPYENIYIWISGEKIIIIEKTIGFNVLEKYIDKYPVSIISEEYDDDEDIIIKLTEDEEQKIILIENNQYILELESLSESTEKAKFLINDEELYIKVNEEGIVSGLLVELQKVTDDYIELEIKKQVIDSIELEIYVNQEERFELDGNSHRLELINENAETREAFIEFDGERYLLERDETESINNVEIKLDEIFDFDSDEESFARFVVWV